MDEDELPIDIHYNKLLDWLIDRRHCDLKWLSAVRPIREKVAACVLQLPSDDEKLNSLKEKWPLNYFHCLQIFNVLKELDGDSKSLFGKFTSARVQSWAEIVHAYEKRSVYLAECAQYLSRNVNYEVPALKQSLSRCQQVQRDSEKREQELLTSASSLRTKFVVSCKEMGVEGVRVREELQALLSELPNIFQQIVDTLPPLIPAICCYQTFIEHTTGKPVQIPQFLPMLSYIMQKGNVTVYEWKHGVAPEPSKDCAGQSTSEHEEDTVQIDWGDLEVPESTAEIDWDHVGQLDASDILVVEDSVEGQTSFEPVLSSNVESLDTILSCSSTRSLFIDDVMELKEFLSRRGLELTMDTDVLHVINESEGVKLHGLHSITEMLDSVSSVLNLLTNSRTQHLLFMKSSAHYLERMATSLLRPQQLSNRAMSQAEAMAARREEAVETAITVHTKLVALIGQTRELQKQVEGQISKLYKNREVNIIGEINIM